MIRTQEILITIAEKGPFSGADLKPYGIPALC